MKKITLYFLTIIALLSFTPVTSMAKSENGTTPTEKVESAEAKVMISRLEEIKSMDKSNMSSKEKKALRKEVRSIKKSLAELNGGVYLSVGAIIIIVLLLILLL
ncbi:MAG: hypothetical protein RLZZ306_3503 [Bacteroidota bacterium]|jgi:hypothetical protein